MGYEVAQFKLTDDSISKFRRWVKKPRDCVINAMELLGILDDQNADIARILIGDTGAQIKQIEDIFEVVEPKFKWNFYKFTNIQTLAQFTSSELKPQHTIFCGYMGNEGHVFLIAKSIEGKVYYVDPQVDAICNLDTNECYNFIDNKKSYFILQASPKK